MDGALPTYRGQKRAIIHKQKPIATQLLSAAKSHVHRHQHARHVTPPSLSIFAPLLLLLPPLFSLPSFSYCVSPSPYFSSGSVVCFQEIRPLLISHMSRGELGKALSVYLCVSVFTMCVYTYVCVCICVCKLMFAHLCIC